MGKKDTQTHRFCFGTPDNPGSAVWRLNAHTRAGDIYLHNLPEFGSSIHVALHASGKFSLKLGTTRYKLQPPFKDIYGLYWGPLIFFRRCPRNLPPPSPTGQVSKVQWLGWPRDGSLFILKFLYALPAAKLVAESDERLLLSNIPAKLFHSDMMVHVFLQERPMTDEEVQGVCAHPPEPLDFGSSAPTTIELIRVSKTELGPSAIIHEPFHASPERPDMPGRTK
jgi:hypothetical protein